MRTTHRDRTIMLLAGSKTHTIAGLELRRLHHGRTVREEGIVVHIAHVHRVHALPLVAELGAHLPFLDRVPIALRGAGPQLVLLDREPVVRVVQATVHFTGLHVRPFA
jgi:hypothetical protein